MNKLSTLFGWMGIVLIQAATMPVSLDIINGVATDRPPVTMVLMMWSGLMFFLVNSIVRKDTLYIVSNSIGFFLQSILLALIVFK